MVDKMRAAVGRLSARLQSHASRQITYKRGGDSVALSATVGRSLLKLSDGQNGFFMVWTDRDYLLPTGGLALSGTLTKPEVGDIIEDAVDGHSYEVVPIPGEPSWRYSDSQSLILRIHTKDIGAT